ncbi:MAG: hypothetical protein WC965_13825, partial [Thiohalomonadaceae bacterium]
MDRLTGYLETREPIINVTMQDTGPKGDSLEYVVDGYQLGLKLDYEEEYTWLDFLQILVDANEADFNLSETIDEAEAINTTLGGNVSAAEAIQPDLEATVLSATSINGQINQDEAIRVANESARVLAEAARLVFENYSASKNYVKGNKVYHDGSSYHALKASKGVTPGTDSNTWLLFARKGVDGTVAFEELTPGQILALKGDKGEKGD